MWEKEISDEDAKPEKVNDDIKAANLNETDISILILQTFIALAIVVIILAFRTALPTFFAQIRTEYLQIMNTGIDASSQTEIIRFANGIIDDLRISVQNIANQLEKKTAQGGFNPASENALQLGASNSRYRISDKLFCPAMGIVSSHFGLRNNPVLKDKDFHEGLDIASPLKSSVFAALSGKVVQTGYDKIRGNYIIMEHSTSLQTLYQHLYSINVRKDDFVYKGKQIGTVGSTGLSTGAHLHFEIIIDGVRVNPSFTLILDEL